MKILNLYAGIGGNRKLWTGHEITAVENNPKIAEIYADLFPEDQIIIKDAKQYLLQNHKRFDFIWASPPCPDNSRARFWAYAKTKPVFPDLTTYELYIFLKHHFDGLFVIENVDPYYEPLIPANKVGRHLFWSNFRISNIKFESNGNQVHKQLAGNTFKHKLQRNKTDPEIGLYILNCALNIHTRQNEKQINLFE